MPTIESGFKQHQAGNWAEADLIYREILAQQPNHVDANHLLGVLAHQLGNQAVAIAYIQKAIKLNPQNPDFYNNLGEAYRLSGKFTEAIAQYHQALKLQPHNGKTYYNLGNATQAQGNDPKFKNLAIAHYQKAIELMPSLAQAHHNLGFLLAQTGEITRAITAYRQALALNPEYVQALNNLANALQAVGEIEKSLDIFARALKIAPNSAEIYNDLGNALQTGYEFEQATAAYQTAITLKANFAEAYYNLGNAYKISTRFVEAEAAYRQAILIRIDNADWYVTLGDLLKEQNRIDEAIAQYEQALILNNELLEAKLKITLALPIIYHTSAEITHWRQRFSTGLSELEHNLQLDTPEQIKEALRAIHNSTNFYLQYQAQNDLDLQTQYGKFVQKIMAAAYPQYSQPLLRGKIRSKKIRLGFISSYFRNHTVGKLFLGWMQNCDRTQFEIYCYYTGKLPTPATDDFGKASDFIYHLPHLDTAIAQIADDKLDILIFTDMGMNPETTQIGALRLAPLQCLAWGHPITSGLSTIDYFLSSELMEPTNAESHYLEQLVRLPKLSIFYPKPQLADTPLTRSQFQIPEDAVIYLCCQSLYKYLPQYDYIFVAIAARVPNAKFVFISSNNGNHVTQQFQRRLQTAFATLNTDQEYCLLMPRLDRHQYLSLNMIADVFLDTIDWSGGNTTLEVIAVGNLPIVTYPKDFMRSRHSYAMLQILEITETIAQNEVEYIDIAVNLGLDKAWRENIKTKTKNHSDRLYSDLTCIKALEKFLVDCVS